VYIKSSEKRSNVRQLAKSSHESNTNFLVDINTNVLADMRDIRCRDIAL
jgi:hypothetical protein